MHLHLSFTISYFTNRAIRRTFLLLGFSIWKLKVLSSFLDFLFEPSGIDLLKLNSLSSYTLTKMRINLKSAIQKEWGLQQGWSMPAGQSLLAAIARLFRPSCSIPGDWQFGGLE